MRELAIAFLIYVGLSMLIFFAMCAAGVEQSSAAQVFPALAALVPCLSVVMKEQRQKRDTLVGRKPIVNIEAFGIHPVLVCFCAVTILVSATYAIISMNPSPKEIAETLPGSGDYYLGVVVIGIGYMTSRWVGRRCRGSWKICALANMPVFTAFTALGLWTMRRHISELVTGSEGIEYSIGVVLGEIIVIGGPLLGLWQGLKDRRNAYISYLLGSIDSETQRIFLELMRDEIDLKIQSRNA